MTIAAGFVAADGILLCTDSQFTGAQKVYRRKIFHRTFGAISAAFALSGDEDYAGSAIEDCFDSLQKLPHDTQTFSAMRATIRECLKRMVEDYKASKLEPYNRPEFMVALTTPGACRLFSTKGMAVRSIERFDMRGSASYLGDYIMSAFHEMTLDFMTVEDFVLAGLWAVAAAKYHDAFCGGGSQFLAIGRDGAASGIGAYRFDATDEWLLEFDRMARRLFLVMASTRSSQKDFKGVLDSFCRDVEKIREIIHRPGSLIRGIVDSLKNATSSQQ